MPSNKTARKRGSVAAAPMKTKSQRREAAETQLTELSNFRLQSFRACNPKQKHLHTTARNNPLVLAIGPAGTGKSYAGAHAACQLFFEGKIDQIILTRNPLPTGTSLGFFAGSDKEKMATWLGPVIGTLKKILKNQNGSDGQFNYMVEKGQIQYLPLETVKGSSYDRTFILVEESQELSLEQLKTLTTRVGTDSYMFLNGDLEQANNRNKGERGFREFVQAVFDENEHSKTQDEGWDAIEIPVVEFDESEIVRSDITRKVVTMFKRRGL